MFFFLFAKYSPSHLSFWIYLIISIFCKFAVPLFFSISGALLLVDDSETLATVFAKRIWKIFCVLFLFSFFYYYQQVYIGNELFSISRFLSKLYEGYWNSSYWYLYAYISFLVSLPLLRKFVKELETQHYYYMIGLAVFYNGILPVVEYYIWQGDISLNGNLRINWIINNIVLYPCIGFFLEHKLTIERRKIKKVLYALWGLNLLCIGVSCYMTYYKAKLMGECSEGTSQTFHNSFVIVNCISVFLTVKYFFRESPILKIMEKRIISLGRCTFGIYLFHIAIMRVQAIWGLWDFFQSGGASITWFQRFSFVC